MLVPGRFGWFEPMRQYGPSSVCTQHSTCVISPCTQDPACRHRAHPDGTTVTKAHSSLLFDPTAGASANPPPSATPPPQQQQQQRATPAPPRAPAPAYPQSFTSRTSLLVFLLHLFLVLAGLLHLVPFVPFSNTAYVYFMRAAVACQLLKTYTAHGKPHFPPWSNIMVGCVAAHVVPGLPKVMLLVLT